MKSLRIGIDLMGSDCSPCVLFEAVRSAAEEFPYANFVVFVTQAALDEILPRYFKSECPIGTRVEFRIVSEVIEMNEDPLSAFREKKRSSLLVALKLLKKRDLDALVSSGNTGALITGSALTLPLLPGIKRPALLALLPTEKKNVAVIDVGGNVSCKASHLLQFARTGVAYSRCISGAELPRVGLLNVGTESKKGTREIREAYRLLEDPLNREEFRFIGNVEARGVFQGNVDVLVTDGFTGNILLKASEGVSCMILEELHRSLDFLPVERRREILAGLRLRFDCEEYPGAIVSGIGRLAIKCHGRSSGKGLLNGIKGAVTLIQNGYLEKFLNVG